MKTFLLTAVLLYFLSSCNLLPVKKPTQNENPIPDLTGSWKILTMKGVDAAGRIHYPFEKEVNGFTTFDRANNFSMQFYASSRPVFSNRDPYFCSDAEIRIAFLSESSAYGTFRQTTDSIFLQTVASNNPSRSWSHDRYAYKIHGDTLLLISSPKKINGQLLAEYSVWLRSSQ